MQEALRLFPPGHIAIREAVEDLDLDGHFVPKGTWLHVRLPRLVQNICPAMLSLPQSQEPFAQKRITLAATIVPG